jgi:hypothetical protein
VQKIIGPAVGLADRAIDAVTGFGGERLRE